MTNMNAIHQNVFAAVAALAVSALCVLGTVGPIDNSETAQPVQLQTDQGAGIIVTGQLA